MSSSEELKMNLMESIPMEEDPIFALDIGTRSIIGIVAIPDGDILRVLDIQIEEHTKRAMVDGQIEDIDQTAKVASIVKQRLEKTLGITLKNVYVAAAGRALRTKKAEFEMEIDPKEQIQDQKVMELETQAILQAQEALLQSEEGQGKFYCVGHSVIKYYLDDYPLSTLLNHRGSRAKVEIIATFLPNEVVESLYVAMEKTGLTVANVTLEPIAAMNAIIPSELRMLNLVLVDVGAGTSDIAISNGGSVSAYTMATIAGDEITETIVKEFLVDFSVAEKMKLKLSENVGSIEYNDILGFSYTISGEEVLEKIRPSTENLAAVICEKIMEINEKPPAAVFMVGGGSQIPTFCQNIAKGLSIAENKVAVGGNNYMKKMIEADYDLKNPEFATPMGIAITAMLSRSRDIFCVTVNNEIKRIFKSSILTVVDVLLFSGYKQGQIIGRSGKSVTLEVNGEKRVVRGGYPMAATVILNGKPASISTSVKSGDVIQFEPAVQGEDAAPTVAEMMEDWNEFEVFLNGVSVRAGKIGFLNGRQVEGDQLVSNLDNLETRDILDLSELCAEARVDPSKYSFLVNTVEQKCGYVLQPEDDIRYFPAVQTALSAQNMAPIHDTETHNVPEPAKYQEPIVENILNVTINGNRVELYPKEDATPYLFLDMLNFVDIDPSRPQGNIVLKINEKDATYLDLVSDGSRIEIYWDKSSNQDS